MGKTKKCSLCNQDIPVERYYKAKHHSDGLYSRCMDCHKITTESYDATNKGKRAALRRFENNKAKDPLKYKARYMLRAAVQQGKIIKPKECTNCSETALLHGHHIDYTNWYDVIWLCSICHKSFHNKLIDVRLLEKAGGR